MKHTLIITVEEFEKMLENNAHYRPHIEAALKAAEAKIDVLLTEWLYGEVEIETKIVRSED